MKRFQGKPPTIPYGISVHPASRLAPDRPQRFFRDQLVDFRVDLGGSSNWDTPKIIHFIILIVVSIKKKTAILGYHGYGKHHLNLIISCV